MSNPEAPPRYWSPHSPGQTRHEQITQNAAPQHSDPVIPTWTDTNDIIVPLPPDTPQTPEEKLQDLLSEERYDRQRLCALVPLVLANAGLASYAIWDAFRPEPPQKKGIELSRQAYNAIPKADANPLNTTPFVLDARATPEGAVCWKKYTTNPTDTGTINTQILSDCMKRELGPNAEPVPSLFIGTIFTITAVVLVRLAFTIASDFRPRKNSILALQSQCQNVEYNGQPLPGPFKTKQPTLKLDRD